MAHDSTRQLISTCQNFSITIEWLLLTSAMLLLLLPLCNMLNTAHSKGLTGKLRVQGCWQLEIPNTAPIMPLLLLLLAFWVPLLLQLLNVREILL